jgi:hypothetical protein
VLCRRELLRIRLVLTVPIGNFVLFDWRSALDILTPATVIAWHRQGFCLFWKRKIRRGRVGRPAVACEVRDLIRKISRKNPLWGSPHIRTELLKVGIDVSETSMAKCMVRHRQPPSQTWRTFLKKHVQNLVSIGFFTVPTIRLQVLYVFLVLDKDAPEPRPIQRPELGSVVAVPKVGGLPHRYERRAA